MRKTLALVAALSVLVVPAVVSGATAEEPRQPGDPCGTTTLEATLTVDPATGLIVCAPGVPLTVREDFVAGGEDRDARRVHLSSFYSIADVQLADEQSPARGEVVDPCGPAPGVSSSAHRPHEAFVPHLMNAHVKAANRVAEQGGPILGQPLDFVVGLGDLADNQQYNEIRWIIDIFGGNTLIDPSSGARHYEGVQAEDPRGGRPEGTPPREGRNLDPEVTDAEGNPVRVLDLANEPFWATGLRTSDGRIPWYSLPGNHDIKVQGTLPDESTGDMPYDIPDDHQWWRALSRDFVVGSVKFVHDLPPQQKQDLCRAMADGDQAGFQDAMTRILTGDPEGQLTRRIITPDGERMFLYRSQEMKRPGDEELCLAATQSLSDDQNRAAAEHACRSSWIDEHRITTGTPVGHGYGEDDGPESPRCRDEEGNLLPRACYAWTSDDGLFRHIGLDSNPPEGFETGNIDPEQFAWLERELIAHSSYYYDENGERVDNPDGDDKLIITYAHHPQESMTNTGLTTPRENPWPFPRASSGKTGEELRDLQLRFPNVILAANGHTHRNRIWARGCSGCDDDDGRDDTGYWEVNTSAITDYPQQSRVTEIADNRDGTLSIFSVVIDALVPPNAEEIDWFADDTPESQIDPGLRDINEDWLASWGREVGYFDPNYNPPYDPQTDLTRIGTPGDRNVELVLPAPEWLLTAEPQETSITYTGDTSGRVGEEARVAAVLSTQGDVPVPGETLTFTRGAHSVTAVTDADGLAETTLRITGPPGSGDPIVVSFAGTDELLPAEIVVGFTAATPGQGEPRPRASATPGVQI